MKKLLIILSVWIVAGCNDIENCDTNEDQDAMIVRFFDFETKQPKNVGFEIVSDNPPVTFVIAIESVVNGETVILTETDVLVLPLNPDSNEITYTFNSDTSSHTLTMSYTPEITIFDPKCEPSLTFVNLDTVRQTFDSTVVVGTVTNRQLSTNVEIYF